MNWLERILEVTNILLEVAGLKQVQKLANQVQNQNQNQNQAGNRPAGNNPAPQQQQAPQQQPDPNFGGFGVNDEALYAVAYYKMKPVLQASLDRHVARNKAFLDINGVKIRLVIATIKNLDDRVAYMETLAQKADEEFDLAVRSGGLLKYDDKVVNAEAVKRAIEDIKDYLGLGKGTTFQQKLKEENAKLASFADELKRKRLAK